MSSDASLPFLQQILSLTQVYGYVTTSAFVILVYDTALTFNNELEFIWNRKWRLGGVLYCFARYCGLISFISSLISDEMWNWSLAMCNLNGVLGAIMDLLSRTGIRGILIGRVYAVTRANRCILGGLVFLWIADMAVSIAQFPFEMCSASTSVDEDPKSSFGVLATTQSVIFCLSEAVIVAATICAAWHHSKKLNIRHILRMDGSQSLTVLFLQQGILRFVIIFFWALHYPIVSQLINTPFLDADIPFENAVSTILICRFMLQLHKFHSKPRLLNPERLRFPTDNTFQSALTRFSGTLIEEFGDDEASNAGEKLAGVDGIVLDIFPTSGTSPVSQYRELSSASWARSHERC